MSREDPKPSPNQPHPEPNHNDSAEQIRKVSGKIHVNGEIEANIPADAIERYKAARQENTSRDNWRFLVECLTLLAVVFYAGLAFWQGWMTRSLVKTAQDTFEASNRPYIGVDSWDIAHPFKDGNGKVTQDPTTTNPNA
jgi:hypothetical protein